MSHMQRVEISDAEAASVGITDATLDWPPLIRPLLIKKGMAPESVTDDAPLRWWWDNNKKVMVFEVAHG